MLTWCIIKLVLSGAPKHMHLNQILVVLPIAIEPSPASRISPIRRVLHWAAVPWDPAPLNIFQLHSVYRDTQAHNCVASLSEGRDATERCLQWTLYLGIYSSPHSDMMWLKVCLMWGTWVHTHGPGPEIAQPCNHQLCWHWYSYQPPSLMQCGGNGMSNCY